MPLPAGMKPLTQEPASGHAQLPPPPRTPAKMPSIQFDVGDPFARFSRLSIPRNPLQSSMMKDGRKCVRYDIMAPSQCLSTLSLCQYSFIDFGRFFCALLSRLHQPCFWD